MAKQKIISLKDCLIVAGTIIVIVAVFILLYRFYPPNYNQPINLSTIIKQEKVDKRQKPAPIKARGVYLTAWSAGGGKVDTIISLSKRSEINSVVIDIKDCSGKVLFDTTNVLANEIGAKDVRINNLPTLLDKLHQANIYAIARLVVFQDPILARAQPNLTLKNKQNGRTWLNNRGIAWVDPSARDVWKYNADLAKEAIDLGFDEVNFDYIRFPSDGRLSLIDYPFYKSDISKHQVMEQFFSYLHQQLKDLPAYHSVDLFGLALWDPADDLNIGQRLLDALPNFDYVCPMVYPSHYYSGFEGIDQPAEHPYRIIARTLEQAKKQVDEFIVNQQAIIDDETKKELAINNLSDYDYQKIRPWIQAFDMGAIYNKALMCQQKQAILDAGLSSWLYRNPYNNYADRVFSCN